MSRFFFVFSVFLTYVYLVGSYEFGYHPSAEEFDSTWRDKSWTRSILQKDRDQKKFVPKFSSESNQYNNRDNILINSEFTKPLLETNYNYESDSGFEDSYVGASSSNVIKVHSNAYETNITEAFHNSAIHIDQIQKHPKFPIYFTNPVTGILYAITEVGYNKNATKFLNNGTIPIYITKEQYDRDIDLLKRKYTENCSTPHSPDNKFSEQSKTTKRPLIKYLNNINVNKITTNPSKLLSTVKPKVTNSTRTTGKKRKISRPHSNMNHQLQLDQPKIIQGNRTRKHNGFYLDTQVEKPGNESSTMKVSVGTTAFSLPKRPIRIRRPPIAIHSLKTSLGHQRKKLKRLTRSISGTSNDTAGTSEETQRSLVNPSKYENYNQSSTDVNNKSKKVLSTQIHVTSEYVEPNKVQSAKNSVEEEIKMTPTKPTKTTKNTIPCDQSNNKKQGFDEDYYNFDDVSYKDDDYYGYSDEQDDSIYTSASASASMEDNTSPMESDENKIHERNKKRVKRLKAKDEYYDDYDYDGAGGVMDLFRGMFMPVQMVMEKVFIKAGNWLGTGNDFDDMDGDVTGYYSSVIDKRKPKFPKYTIYNNGINSANGSSNIGGNFVAWLGSWFGQNQNEKIDEVTVISIGNEVKPTVASSTAQPGWLESWWGDEKTPPNHDADDYGKWFLGWFDTPTSTAMPTTTTPVPILTIADPLKNPQKWIGILAQHIVNSSTTVQPPSASEVANEIPVKISYDKYQIWRLKPQDDSQLKALDEYKQSEEGSKIQWLMGPSLRGLTDVLVPPTLFTNFQGTLNFENIGNEVLIYDVGKAIFFEESKEKLNLKRPLKHGLALSWLQYYDYDHIILFLEQMQMKHSHLIELIHLGRSYEGRPLILVKIESSKEEATKKQKTKLKQKLGQSGDAVFIETGVHGREWIGPATGTWIINELVKIMKNNRTSLNTEYIRNTTWYIMPVLNPDSYVYSHDFDRMWKKSRSKNIAQPDGIINSALTWLQQRRTEKTCFGVDLDRNWDHEWGKKGSSKSPCNEFFAGKSSLSEPETKAVSKFLMDNRKQIKLFISLQSYGQVISYPNKIGSSLNNQKWDDLLDVAMVGIEGLRKRGSTSRYKIDSTNDLIAHKTGSSDSFAMFEAGIPFSYRIHLGDNGVHGYLLPPSYIEPIAKEAFEIITAIIDYI